MQDEDSLALWNRSLSLVAQIPIEGMEDPVYIVNTGGLVSNKIKRTPHTTFVQGTNISALSNHSLSSYYRDHTDAPSFLGRLQGNLTASPYGVESMVNLQKLAAQGVPTSQKSVIDYIYFSTSNPSTNGVSGMSAWFRLDSTHLAYYNATHLAI
jgi:hypothetical protein